VLGGLVAALLAENRRTDSRWHGYLTFLHEVFDSVRESALFWPLPFLGALNATVGLDFLISAAQAHRGAAALLDELPELLASGGTASDPTQGAQPIFDAEMHWAVTTALCRGILDPKSGLWQLLPGSELLKRGDSRTANVHLRRGVPGGSLPASSVEGGWSLVATRAVGAGEALVIDGKMGNLELLVRGWAALEANGHGPVIPLASFGNGVLEVAEVLADAARDTQGGSKSHDEAHVRVGAKWHQWRCKEELRTPRISCDLDSSAFPRALVICIAYSIRLLELSAGPVENADWSETSKGVDVGTDSGFRELESGFDDTWKDRVLHRAYGLIAQGCESAENGTELRLCSFLSIMVALVPRRPCAIHFLMPPTRWSVA